MARLFDACETTIHSIAYYEQEPNSFILQELGEPIMDHYLRNPCGLRELLQALLDVSDALACIH